MHVVERSLRQQCFVELQVDVVQCWMRCVCVCMDMAGCDVHMYTRACVCSMFGLYATVDVTALMLQFVCVCVYMYMCISVCVQVHI